MTTLADFVAAELARPAPAAAAKAAQAIAERLDGRAVLFYGSVLRTGDLDGVLDFYVLTDRPPHRGFRAFVSRWLWPDVSYHEIDAGDRIVRAKVATMPLDTFRAAADGRFLDTTIWARFVQPVSLIWARDDAVQAPVGESVAAAAMTAARFAAALGAQEGLASDFWKALFRKTYATEFRVERPGREDQIIAYDRGRFDALLPLAWKAAGIHVDRDGETLRPVLPLDERRRLLSAWSKRARAGKPLNLARLAKAAFTFDGAARYALWKVERHTGLHVPLTPWRERHPILAAPGVLWRIWRTASQR